MKEYQPSLLFKNNHINTCFPTFFRRISLPYVRKRIETKDGDFLDFDFFQQGNKKLLILCHGLEGSSKSHYIKAFAKYFGERSWDSLAINYRSCSGEVNKSSSFYVAGKGDEIDLALEQAKEYEEIVLVGFSLGANKVLHYLGKAENIPKNVKGGVAVSPPCDLKESSFLFTKGFNKVYEQYFIDKMKKKLLEKRKKYPHVFEGLDIPFEDLDKVRDLVDFDNKYTSKVTGFQDAFDYYKQNSSLFVLNNIHHKTLILTALDDPMMSPNCYPYEEVEKNPYLELKTPQYGGHISYASFSKVYWLESFVYDYVEKNILGTTYFKK